MEDLSSFHYARKPVPVSTMHETDNTTVSSIEDYAPHDDATVSLVSSERNSSLSEYTSRPIADTTRKSTSISLPSSDHENMPSLSDRDFVDASPTRQSYYQKIKEAVTNFWLWEAAACALSLICLASIIGVLMYENNKQLDQWMWRIPPTAVVSFIGTLAKGSLVLVLSQVLSQLKWLCFSEVRSVRHFRAFDSASRGPFGAVLVVWNSRKMLVSIAALLMILATLIDPFIQLVFTFPSHLVPDDSQKATFQRVYAWGGDSGQLPGLPSQRLWTSVNQGFIPTDVIPAITCSSGSCNWTDTIRTLGVCASCTDVTSDVKVTCSKVDQTVTRSDSTSAPGQFGDATMKYDVAQRTITCDYEFPDGDLSAQEVSFGGGSGKQGASPWLNSSLILDISTRTLWNSSTTSTSPRELNVPLCYQHNKTRIEVDGHDTSVNAPFMQVTATPEVLVNATDGTLLNFNAIQIPMISSAETINSSSAPELPAAKCWSCKMTWCERAFENLHTNGSTPPVYNISTKPLWFIGIEDQLGFYPSDVDSLNLSTVWNFKYRLESTLPTYLKSLFEAYWVQHSGTQMTDLDELSSYSLNGTNTDSGHVLSWNPGVLQGLLFSDDLNTTIRTLADSLSESMRTGSDAVNVTGKALVSKTFIQVRWEWLVLPIALMAITCVLLPIVIIKSRAQKVAPWKDDPLALLFHRIEAFEDVPGSNSKIGPMDLDTLADKVYVRLDSDSPFTFVRAKGTTTGRQV